MKIHLALHQALISIDTGKEGAVWQQVRATYSPELRRGSPVAGVVTEQSVGSISREPTIKHELPNVVIKRQVWVISANIKGESPGDDGRGNGRWLTPESPVPILASLGVSFSGGRATVLQVEGPVDLEVENPDVEILDRGVLCISLEGGPVGLRDALSLCDRVTQRIIALGLLDELLGEGFIKDMLSWIAYELKDRIVPALMLSTVRRSKMSKPIYRYDR